MGSDQVSLRSALAGLDIGARRIVDGVRAGGHASARAGGSVEFDRYRAYQPGDDLRHLDWRVFARSERLVLKRARLETTLDVIMILDASASMLFDSGGTWGSKFDLARSTLQAITWLAVEAGDRVTCCRCTDATEVPMAPRSGAAGLLKVMEVMEDPADRGVSIDLDEASLAVTQGISRPGLVVLGSDLLDDPVHFQRAAGRLRHAGHDVLVIQVLDRAERRFEVPDEARLRDLEGSQDRRLNARSVRDDYLEALHAHQQEILRSCRGLHVDHILIDPHESPVPVLRSMMQHRSGRQGSSRRTG